MSFSYIYKGVSHTDATIPYMQQLGMSEEQIESVQQQRDYEYKKACLGIRTECERRILKRWSIYGQINCAMGIYDPSEIALCKNCIDAHRDACNALLEREDLLEINYTDDAHWPGD